jgi:hypothetical protein
VRRALVTAAAAALVLAAAAPAEAARTVQYGIQDDAFLLSGPGSLESRVGTLEKLGVDVVRFTLRWDVIARRRPTSARSHEDAAYRWETTDAVLAALRARRIAVVATILGTPRWANGGRAPQWAPRSGRTLGDFAFAAGRRYPWIKRWTMWNEPNQRRWLRPTNPRTYVRRILNPGYAQLHRAVRGVQVAGGVTAPRGAIGGVSPVAWIRGMRAARARLDVYAHNPYPERPRVETPWSGGCTRCQTITMATLGRLQREVGRAFGRKPLWLTEYGYQSNPPERGPLGVPLATQAAHVGSAARRAYTAAGVQLLIQFLLRDDGMASGWQSGLMTVRGRAKPSFRAFMLPLTQVARRGSATTLWGQVRPRSGRQPYRVRVSSGRGWRWATSTRVTNGRGFFSARVRAGRGARVQIWSPRDRTFSPPLSIR